MRITYKPVTALMILLSAIVLTIHAQGKKPLPKLGKNSLKEVVDAMTLEEKAKLVVGMGFKMPGMPPPEKGKKPQSCSILNCALLIFSVRHYRGTLELGSPDLESCHIGVAAQIVSRQLFEAQNLSVEVINRLGVTRKAAKHIHRLGHNFRSGLNLWSLCLVLGANCRRQDKK